MNRGEIWLTRLPSQGGREQAGTRPALVLQDACITQRSATVLIAPLSSQLGVLRFSGTIRLDPSSANGLKTVSVVMLFQLRALDRNRFIHRIGEVTAEELAHAYLALDELCGRV